MSDPASECCCGSLLLSLRLPFQSVVSQDTFAFPPLPGYGLMRPGPPWIEVGMIRPKMCLGCIYTWITSLTVTSCQVFLKRTAK